MNKKYLVTSWETAQYTKVIDANSPEQAKKKAYKDNTTTWEECYDNCETVDTDVEEYNG